MYLSYKKHELLETTKVFHPVSPKVESLKILGQNWQRK